LTPLHYASREGHILIVKSLIKHKADVNKLDPCEGTPLFLASRYGRQNIVEILLENGADVSKKNYGTQSILEILLENRADVSKKNLTSKPAYNLTQNQEIKALLRQAEIKQQTNKKKK
jgi:ankyrin repeat protein